MYRPTMASTARMTKAMEPATLATVTESVAIPPKNSHAARRAAISAPSRTGMPGRERIGFSFMAACLHGRTGSPIDIEVISQCQDGWTLIDDMWAVPAYVLKQAGR